MKKNLVLVLGLVFLLYPLASCEPEDELNSLKTSESPKNDESPEISYQQDHSDAKVQAYDKEQIAAVSCDELESTPLYAAQDIEVGLVHLANSDDYIFVTYDLSHTPWSLEETCLYIGEEQDIPYTKAGNPNTDRFNYRARHDVTNKKEFSFAIPIGEFEECMVMIVHAVVKNDADSGHTESAFAFDSKNEFSGSRSWWFLDYCLHECGDKAQDGDQERPITQKRIDNGDISKNNGDIEYHGSPYGSGPDCLETYAFHSVSQSDAHCFLSSGFDRWGWTNQVFYNPQMNYVTSYVLDFPLLASAYQCDIRNSLEVGYITVRVNGSEGDFTAELDVHITDETYYLQTFDLYVGTEKYPLDNAMDPTVLPEFYNYHESVSGTRRLTLYDIPWPSNTYFIARGLLCPANL